MTSIHIAASIRYADPVNRYRQRDLPKGFFSGYTLTFCEPVTGQGELTIASTETNPAQKKLNLPGAITIPFSREDFDLLARIFTNNPNGLQTVYPHNSMAVLNIAPEGMADLRRQLERPTKPVGVVMTIDPRLIYTPA